MSKKLYIGIASGILLGLSISALLKFHKEEDLFSDEDLSGNDDMLNKANHYLILARNKVSEMVNEAEQKSNSYLNEAGKILSLAKEKTSSIHFENKMLSEGEIDKIRSEIETCIEELNKRIDL